jgi:hypothetical protein
VELAIEGLGGRVMVAVFSYSEAGEGHRENEDAFAVRAHPADESALLCFLADGQEGQPGCGTAARTATQSAMEILSTFHLPSLLARPPAWPDLLGRADQATAADPEAGYTTLLGFRVGADRLVGERLTLVGASVGESAVWLLDRAAGAQELTRKQRKDPPVGSGEARFVHFQAELRPPWLALAMSDGVWKSAGWKRVKDLAGRYRGQALMDELQSVARSPRGGTFPDDFTLIVIQDSE